MIQPPLLPDEPRDWHQAESEIDERDLPAVDPVMELALIVHGGEFLTPRIGLDGRLWWPTDELGDDR